MMATNKEIIQWLQDKIASSTDITDYCNTNFSKEQTVFVGVNADDVPRKEEKEGVVVVNNFPFATIVPLPDKTGDMPNGSYSLAIGFGIEDGATTVSGKKVTYEGLYAVEESANFVEDILEIDLTDETNAQNLSMTYHNEPIEEYPFCFGVIQVSFNLPIYVGGKATFLT